MRLPPYAALLGVELVRSDAGRPELVMPFHAGVVGRPGFLQGGAIAGLLEVAAVVALRQALEERGGGHIKPIGATVDFMRGGRDHETRAAGIVRRLGSRIANMEAFAWQDDRDRPIAAARLNFLLTRPEE